jgi:GNAT superfamily N-acetyltransferase
VDEQSAAAGQLQITRASLAEWPVIAAWAAAEGWNPGPADGACFLAQDPDGFFLGTVDGRPVSAVSVVNYGDAFSFLGLYLVDPAYRGLGHGFTTWLAALPHAGSRTIGLDGVVDQQENYRRSGFTLAYRNIRYLGDGAFLDEHEHERERKAGAGADRPAPASFLRPATEVGLPAIAEYDTRCFPAERPVFLERWLTAPGHIALAAVEDGRVTGYAVLRPAPEFAKIGPLFADTPAVAEALFDALVAAADGGPVALDVPEANPAAVALAEARGLKPVFETARMYTGPVRDVAMDRIFGVTTLELG